jgi:hypothetical protein
MKRQIYSLPMAALLGLGLMASTSAFGGESSLPDQPQAQSPVTQSVQAEVDNEAANKAAEKRRKILTDASAAIEETKKALQALQDGDTESAMKALETATGKLELILARDPALGLAPVDTEVLSYDLLASVDTVKAIIHDAEDYLEDGEIQKARPLVANLASEIVFRTTSIPLSTYPDAIKAVIPMIDEGRIDEAREALQTALNTLVVTTDEIIPLPVLRAEQLLERAETLAENKERSEKENQDLIDLLAGARNQLRMAEVLGYGTQESFQPMYEQLDTIEDKTAGGRGGKGWFDRIKQQVTELF